MLYLHLLQFFIHGSYMTLIGAHELLGRMHPNQNHVTILLACSEPGSCGLIDIRAVDL